ncbi:SDR family NAD(P)-dependent oxidoreductase [Paenibacillus sp. R14(2021)]|uniref:SDR family NAD(P)-dependent oxidoreductase n=1 Tax=Paenibacillus sp. R14(2021) TaxID=2859228 RepID=UPI002157DAE7|nr:SDR family NAD(P)-dependent oxidoreductase [Paenibacillus sp. R14(2021)]
MLLHGKICVITGGGSGIGEVTAKRFAEEGGIVMLADIDERNSLRTAEDINAAYGAGSATAYRVDVSNESEVRSWRP